MSYCKDCKNTGTIETGNNDLPYHCSAGDTALFNCAGSNIPLTGAQIKGRLPRSDEPCGSSCGGKSCGEKACEATSLSKLIHDCVLFGVASGAHPLHILLEPTFLMGGRDVDWDDVRYIVSVGAVSGQGPGLIEAFSMLRKHLRGAVDTHQRDVAQITERFKDQE